MERPDPTAGNDQLTATTAVVLLVLLAAEGVTILSIRSLLPAHIVIGLLLIPPVALKLASTGYRFLRYYNGHCDYVDKGPPHIVMRLLAPLLVLATLTVLGTGIGLLAFGPQHHRDILLGLHKVSFVIWFGLMSIHVVVYAPRLPRLVSARGALAQRATLVASSVFAGALLAGAAYSLAGPWVDRAHDHEREHAAEFVSSAISSANTPTDATCVPVRRRCTRSGTAQWSSRALPAGSRAPTRSAVSSPRASTSGSSNASSRRTRRLGTVYWYRSASAG